MRGTSQVPSRIGLVLGCAVSKKKCRFERVLVMPNSNYRREPALQELEAYAPLTSADSYCVVFDTLVELPDEIYVDRFLA